MTDDRITQVLQQRTRPDDIGDDYNRQPADVPPADSGSAGIRFGKPKTAYSSGSTIILTPCDSAGTATGEGDVTAQAGWTFPSVSGTALSLPTTAVIPFQYAADGKCYAIGQPKQVVTAINFDTSTHYLQQKIRYDFGVFCSTESDWQDVQDFVDCTEAGS